MATAAAAAAMEKNKILQLYRQAEELKALVSRKKTVLYADGEAWAAHQQLQSLLQTLLLTDLNSALDRKVEADLWNVCFKDYISHLQAQANQARNDKAPSTAKKRQASEAQVTLTWFLDMASGFYLMLLQDVRRRFDLDLPFLRSGSVFGMFKSSDDDSEEDEEEEEDDDEKRKKNLSNCVYICQHCLVHLGDIARYRNQARQAEGFYRQAIQIAPGSGQAYNQIALLNASRGDKLSAIFHYVRALALKCPFPAAASNLSKLFSRIEQDQKSLPTTPDTRINSQTFVPYVLRLHALLHHAQHLRTAAKLCHLLNQSLTALVAAESLGGAFQLVQVSAVGIFLHHQQTKDGGGDSRDERIISGILCEHLAGMLNAFLLPVYTLKQGASLLDYFALPAAKLILEWIALNPSVLEEKGFLKRLQIWPSLCRMLNELSSLTFAMDEELKTWDDVPLQEDRDLQAFLPLLPRLKRYSYKQKNNNNNNLAPSYSTENENHQRLLRARRMTQLGRLLASEEGEFKGRKMLACRDFEDINSSAQLTFEAVEHKVPEELVRELDAVDLESSSSEDDEERSDGDDEEDKKQGILKATGAATAKDDDSVIAGRGKGGLISAAALSKKPGHRTNVAMANIMANMSSSGGSNSRQVTFKSPSPAPSNSQESSTMSQDSCGGGGTAAPLTSTFQPYESSSLLHRLSSNSVHNSSSPLSMMPSMTPPPTAPLRKPVPARPPPDFSVPPPPVLHPQRASLGLIAPPRTALGNPYQQQQLPQHHFRTPSDIWASTPRPPVVAGVSSSSAVARPQQPLSDRHQQVTSQFGGLGLANLQSPDYSSHLLSLFSAGGGPASVAAAGRASGGTMPMTTTTSLASVSVPQAQSVVGPSYSLFSGPSWSGAHGSLLGNTGQESMQGQDQNIFQAGPSALERLLRQQKKE